MTSRERQSVKNFVVVSAYFPPVVGGTSTVMRNLLAAFRPESYTVIAEDVSSFDGVHNARVPAGVSVNRVGVPAFVGRKIPYGLRITRWLRFGLIPRIEQQILAARAEAIVAVFPSWPFLIAAYRAHLRSGVPLFTYYMDVSVDASQFAWPDRPAVRFYEQKILRAASQRLVLSDAIGADFRERLGLDSVTMPITIDLHALPAAPSPPAQLAQWKTKRLIVHTGVVEEFQRESLLRIARTLHEHPELDGRLVLTTPNSRKELLAVGFDFPCVEIASLDSGEVLALQRAADLLVAVLPFHGAIESYQRTSFPSKCIEYMAAGVPILAHAPADSFFARHIAARGYAFLVDHPEETVLADALRRLLGDDTLRSRLIERARAVVLEEFALANIATRFADTCGIDRSALAVATVQGKEATVTGGVSDQLSLRTDHRPRVDFHQEEREYRTAALIRNAAVHAASAVLRPFLSGLGCIVVLHRVLPETGHSRLPANRALEITPNDLRAMLAWVRERGMEPITLDAVPSRLRTPRAPRFIAFTFDDGYRDNLEYGLPIFREFQTPFAMNVTNGFADGSQSIWWYFLEEVIAAKSHLRFSWEGKVHEFVCNTARERNLALEGLSGLIRNLGTSRDLLLQCIAEAAGVDPLACTRRLAMGWEEVRKMAADPLVTIGAHSACHHSLNRLSADEIAVEVFAAKRELEEQMGRNVCHFAYPFGGANAADQREFEIVRRAGFTTMLTTRPANLFPRYARRLDRLPRFGISGNYAAVKSLVMIESGLSAFLQERADKHRGSVPDHPAADFSR